MKQYKNILQITLDVNDEKKDVIIRPSDTLLSTLRNKLGLTGAKRGCENGDCGACTVLIDNLPIKACIMLTVEAINRKITTIEGVKDDNVLSAFKEEFAFQCGFCTPGFIMNCIGLSRTNFKVSEKEVEAWLSSNLCRCTCYEEISRAIEGVLNK